MMKKRMLALLMAAALLLPTPALAAEPGPEAEEAPERAEVSIVETEIPAAEAEVTAPETEAPEAEAEPPAPKDAEAPPEESTGEAAEAPEASDPVQLLADVQTVYASDGDALMGYLTDGTSNLEIVLSAKTDYIVYSTETYTDINGVSQTRKTGWVLKNLQNVTIRGSQGTQILTPSGGDAVITLNNCKNVTLDTLSIGHLEEWCYAPVLVLYMSTGVELLSCDLWGCGYYGIGCTASGFRVDSTTIRDCKGYIMRFSGGSAVFDNCTFRDNGIGYPEKDEKGEITAIQGAPTYADFNSCQFLNNKNTMKLQPGYESAYTFNSCIEENNGWNNTEPVIESLGPTAQLTRVGSAGVITGTGTVGQIPYSHRSLLTEVSVEAGITELGDSCFQGCTVLQKISLPDTLTKIGDSAFAANTKLKLTELPASVTEIGDSAFNGCKSLTELVLPEHVTTIGASCFISCTNLSSITFPKDLKTIGNNAFERCGKLTSAVLPEGLTSVGANAFYQTGLQELTLPESLTSVGGNAFTTAENLKHITLPAKGSGLANGFGWYMDIPLVTLTGSGPMPEDGSIGGGVLSRISSPYTVELQEGITSISANAFQSIASMEEVRIPGSVASIGESAFNNCRGLKRAVFAEGLTSIGKTAFTGCSGLTELTFPNSLTSIGDSAFQSCTGLTELTFPEKLTTIGATAFTGCTGLTALRLPGSLTSIGTSAFQNCTALADLRISGNGAPIGNSAFYGCSGLTAVEIADGIVSIGTSAFERCSALEEVRIAGSVTDIGNRAFYGCTGLKRLTLSEGLKTIGASAFMVDPTIYKGTAGAGSLILPLSLTSIGAEAFKGWNGLRDLSLPLAAQMDNRTTFSGCTGITHIAVRGEGNTPDITTSTGTGGRPWCATKQPLTVELEEGITGIGESYFEDAETLYHITIPSTVTYIKYGAFESNNALQSVSIPASVNRIETYAFHWANKLKDIYYGGSEAEWKAALVDATNSGTRDATIHYNTTEAAYTSNALDTALTDGTTLADAKTALEALNTNSLSRALLEPENRQKLEAKEGSTSVQAEASSPIQAGSVTVTGAKVNFPERTNLALVLSAPENAETEVPALGKTIRFSAKLVDGGTEVQASGLSIPLAVTVRLPDRDLQEQSIRVWHNHNGTLTELHDLRVDSREDGVYLTFLTDGFSDLIATYDTGFSLTWSGNAVQIQDARGILSPCETVFAARYDNGRLTELAAGARGARQTTFSRTLVAGDVLFFLDGDSRPVLEKAVLS